MCERCKQLEDAILAIDAKAALYGSPLIENGEEYVQAYLIPAGPLHRALGVVGHSAAKTLPLTSERITIPASEVGFTLKQELEPVRAPRPSKTYYFD